VAVALTPPWLGHWNPSECIERRADLACRKPGQEACCYEQCQTAFYKIKTVCHEEQYRADIHDLPCTDAVHLVAGHRPPCKYADDEYACHQSGGTRTCIKILYRKITYGHNRYIHRKHYYEMIQEQDDELLRPNPVSQIFFVRQTEDPFYIFIFSRLTIIASSCSRSTSCSTWRCISLIFFRTSS